MFGTLARRSQDAASALADVRHLHSSHRTAASGKAVHRSANRRFLNLRIGTQERVT